MSKFGYLIIFLTAFLALFGAAYLLEKDYQSPIPEPVICTQEAMQCLDGSYVSRTGPRCEFANCPAYNGGYGNLNGRVTISPICPVESVPPQPQCAPKGYSTGIFVSSMNFSKQIYSDSNGYFSISFPIGNYSLKPIVANVLPRCDDVDNVQIKNNSTTTANINCDSGIR